MLGKSYRLGQPSIIFEKGDTLWLLKIHIMFWPLRGPKKGTTSSPAIFLGSTFFLARIFFCGSEIFSGGIFVGSVFFLMADFVIQRFSVFGYMRKSDNKHINKCISNRVFLNRCQQLLVLFILERYFIC